MALQEECLNLLWANLQISKDSVNVSDASALILLKLGYTIDDYPQLSLGDKALQAFFSLFHAMHKLLNFVFYKIEIELVFR